MSQETENIIKKYTEPIFRFCLRRLRNQQEAEDLAQEILLQIFQGMTSTEIRDLNPWIWRIAHNRYARWMQKHSNHPEILSGCAVGYEAVEYDHGASNMISKEENQVVFRALHSLGAMYRDILVQYYVYEKPCREIALMYDIPLSTVKWRLSDGKLKIRERLAYYMEKKTYEAIQFHVMCNGSFNPNQYLDTQMKRAIVKAVYEKPQTIEEISLITGVPTLYLEDELKHLIYGDALVLMGKKYATNFIILKKLDYDRILKKLYPYVTAIGDWFQRMWVNVEEDVRRIGFYGSNLGVERLGYIMLPYMIRGSTETISKKDSRLIQGDFPIRKDGGFGWFIVREATSIGLEESGCNQYGSKTTQGIITYYWIGKYWNDLISEALKMTDYTWIGELAKKDISALENVDERRLAELIKVNVIHKHEKGYRLNIPAFTTKQFEEFVQVMEKHERDLDSLLRDGIYKVWTELKRCIPERLHDQVNQYVVGYVQSVTGLTVWELQKRGFLRIPEEDESFVDSLFYIDGELMRRL